MLLLPACGDSFVETNPPVLERLHVRTSEAVREEPVILGLILDLQIPDPVACRALGDRLEGVHLVSSSEAVRSAYRVRTLVLSPDCHQQRDRRVVISDYQQALLEAMQQYPDAHPRPILLYVNNLDARLSSGLQADLRALKDLVDGLRPELWGVTASSVAEQVGFDQHVTWTWAEDPDLLPNVAALLDARLPFWTGRMPLEVEVLPPEVRARAVAVKICSASEALRDGTVSVEGRAAYLEETGGTPRLSVAPVEDRLARPAPATELRELTWTVEVCSANCDRAIVQADGRVGPWWGQQVGCSLDGAP